jgi:hypothetical protein
LILLKVLKNFINSRMLKFNSFRKNKKAKSKSKKMIIN